MQKHPVNPPLHASSATEGASAHKLDPRLSELADMGLPEIWLQIASAIGVDAFFTLWRLLDQEQSLLSDNESLIEIKLRRFRSYQRHQRNRYIATLHQQHGLNKRQIREHLARQFGDHPSESTIARVLKQGEERA